MTISSMLILAVLAQPSGGTRGAETTSKAQRESIKTSSASPPAKMAPIFKVLVWYDRRRPLDTFKYQEYDLRKSEYTPAVDTWVATIRKDFPAYIVVVRDVDAKLGPGQSEKLKVGSVIKDELTVAAALFGVVIGGSTDRSRAYDFAAGAPRAQPKPMALPSSDRSFLNIPLATFPVPVPYSRPHP